jgi:hypothetical protein
MLSMPVKLNLLSPSSCPKPVKPLDHQAVTSPSRRQTSGPSQAHLAVGQSRACHAHPKTKPSCLSGAHQAVVLGNLEPVEIKASGDPEPIKLSGPSQAHLAVGPSQACRAIRPVLSPSCHRTIPRVEPPLLEVGVTSLSLVMGVVLPSSLSLFESLPRRRRPDKSSPRFESIRRGVPPITLIQLKEDKMEEVEEHHLLDASVRLKARDFKLLKDF